LLLTVDLLFLAANLTKLVHGAWLPLLIGVVAFTVLTNWQRGRPIVTRLRLREEGPLREFVDELHQRRPHIQRAPGTAVFLNRTKETAPLAMRASVAHLHVLAEHVVILSIETLPIPYVNPADRLTIDDLGYTDDGITHASVRFGYMDKPNVPAGLAAANALGYLRYLHAGRGELDAASRALSRAAAIIRPGVGRARRSGGCHDRGESRASVRARGGVLHGEALRARGPGVRRARGGRSRRRSRRQRAGRHR
jgi:KUP system potassium uptake protein